MANERRLIDAERVKNMLKKAAVHMLNGYPDSYDTGVSKGLIDAADVVNHAPTVDAAEVVRCKDCENGTAWKNRHGYTAISCKLLCADVTPDDFCSYGERRCE